MSIALILKRIIFYDYAHKYWKPIFARGEASVRVSGGAWLPRDGGADGLALHDGLLFPLREQRDLVIHVLQHNEDGRLAGQLLGAVILQRTFR